MPVLSGAATNSLDQTLDLCVVTHIFETLLECGVWPTEDGPFDWHLALPIASLSHAGTPDGEFRFRCTQILDQPSPVFSELIARDDPLLGKRLGELKGKLEAINPKIAFAFFWQDWQELCHRELNAPHG